MPRWGSQDYKSAVFEQLSKGSDGGGNDSFEHFENFSSGAPRTDVERGVSEAFHPEKLTPDVTEPQFLRAAQNMCAPETSPGPIGDRPSGQMQFRSAIRRLEQRAGCLSESVTSVRVWSARRRFPLREQGRRG